MLLFVAMNKGLLWTGKGALVVGFAALKEDGS